MATHEDHPDVRSTKTSTLSPVRAYYQLTKPGIVYSNALTALAGYLFATAFHVAWSVLAGLLVGTAALIAAACVMNNYLDRNIDAQMTRTKKRPSVTGLVSLRRGAFFAGLLLAVGFGALTFTNGMTMVVGGLAVLSYVVIYGFAKRRSVHGTLVGTLPGAASLVAGYTAATGQFNGTAAALLLIMTTWQMAHFYAIAIFRRDDYRQAGLPVRSVSRGILNTKRQIVAYIILFVGVSCALTFVSRERVVYTLTMVLLGANWLRVALGSWQTADDTRWGRQVFGQSLLILLIFCAVLPLGVLLP